MTLANTDSSQFFGMDLAQWPRQWQAAGALLLEWPLLRQLVPQTPIALRHADGHVSHWALARGQALPARGAQAGAPVPAFALPPDRVLERRLTLPPLAPADVAQAVQLEVASASPFGAEQTVFGHSVRRLDQGVLRVDIAITSRQQIEQALQAAGFSPAQPPEVWVVQGAAGAALHPIVLHGFGEGTRERAVRQGLRRRLGLLALALALLAALVVTPTALMRARAQQAQRSFAALQKEAAPQLAQREALMQRLERLKAVGGLLGEKEGVGDGLPQVGRHSGGEGRDLRANGNREVGRGEVGLFERGRGEFNRRVVHKVGKGRAANELGGFGRHLGALSGGVKRSGRRTLWHQGSRCRTPRRARG